METYDPVAHTSMDHKLIYIKLWRCFLQMFKATSKSNDNNGWSGNMFLLEATFIAAFHVTN